jgi:hypothetical protein
MNFGACVIVQLLLWQKGNLLALTLRNRGDREVVGLNIKYN